MKCVLLFLECHTIEICMDGIHIAQGINQINQRAFLSSPKDNSCSTAARGYYSGRHCPWPSAWVMYTQLTLVIYYSAIYILTSAILFHCHEEPCSISMDTAEAATHAEWAACTVSLTDPNHFDCVMFLPIPSPSCSLLVQWVTYFYEFSSFTANFKRKILTCVGTLMCMWQKEKEYDDFNFSLFHKDVRIKMWKLCDVFWMWFWFIKKPPSLNKMLLACTHNMAP
jgi:hypothetical protein